MSSRVTPFQTSFLENQEIPTLVSVPNVTSDIPFNYENQEQENAREPLLKAVEEVYNPLLRAMKIFGIYFGDDTLNLFRDTSSPYRIRHDRPSTRFLISDKARCFSQSERALYGNFIIIFLKLS